MASAKSSKSRQGEKEEEGAASASAVSANLPGSASGHNMAKKEPDADEGAESEHCS